jgi:copper homeostasis protein
MPTAESAIAVEIAVQDAAGARVAMGAGADRLELCQALEVGGLTPSLGILESVLASVDPSVVNVLVRPRGGGFVYDDEEIAVVAADIRASVERGAGGVVVGALDEHGLLDRDAVRRWRDAAGPATLVFHRAIDASADPAAVFDALLEERVDRVLTSGGAPRSIDGVAALAAFVDRAAGALEVMAGGGVQPADIPAILEAGVGAVHLSARARTGFGAPSGPGGGADGHDATSADIVAEAVAAARA